MRSMRIIIVTPMRVLGDGLTNCLAQAGEVSVLGVAADLGALRCQLADTDADVALIDVTLGVDLADVRAIATERPELTLIALGLPERRQDVIRCGRAGFRGYVSRDASVETLRSSLRDVVAGRLACPAEISSGLLRALFCAGLEAERTAGEGSLTRRESEVLQLIGRGLSNKEIARELTLSVATVKHHVHHVLDKLQLPRRAQAMRRVREAPWIAAGPERWRAREADLG
jgi:DNA-binding NarL/FixJ family response regulator